jgi:hypothetical protein
MLCVFISFVLESPLFRISFCFYPANEPGPLFSGIILSMISNTPNYLRQSGDPATTPQIACGNPGTPQPKQPAFKEAGLQGRLKSKVYF